MNAFQQEVLRHIVDPDQAASIRSSSYVVDILHVLFAEGLIQMPALTASLSQTPYIKTERMAFFNTITLKGHQIRVPYRAYGYFEFDNSSANPFGTIVSMPAIRHTASTIRVPVPDYVDTVHYFNQLCMISKYVVFHGPPPLYFAKPEIALRDIKLKSSTNVLVGELDNGIEYSMTKNGLMFTDLKGDADRDTILTMLKSVCIDVPQDPASTIAKFDSSFNLSMACYLHLPGVKLAYLTDPMNYGSFITNDLYGSSFILGYSDAVAGTHKLMINPHSRSGNLILSDVPMYTLGDRIVNQQLLTYTAHVTTVYGRREMAIRRIMSFFRYAAYTITFLPWLLSTGHPVICPILESFLHGAKGPAPISIPQLSKHGKPLGRPPGSGTARREVEYYNGQVYPNKNLLRFSPDRGLSFGTHINGRKLDAIFPDILKVVPTIQMYNIAYRECWTMTFQEFAVRIQNAGTVPLDPAYFYTVIEDVIKKNLFIVRRNLKSHMDDAYRPDLPRFFERHDRILRYDESVFLYRSAPHEYMVLEIDDSMSYRDPEGRTVVISARTGRIIGDRSFTLMFVERFYLPHCRQLHVSNVVLSMMAGTQIRDTVPYVEPLSVPSTAVAQIQDNFGHIVGHRLASGQVIIHNRNMAVAMSPLPIEPIVPISQYEQLRRMKVVISIMRHIYLRTHRFVCEIGPEIVLPMPGPRSIMLDDVAYDYSSFFPPGVRPVLTRAMFEKLSNYIEWEINEERRVGVVPRARYVAGNFDVTHHSSEVDDFIYRHCLRRAVTGLGSWTHVPQEVPRKSDSEPVSKHLAFWIHSNSGATIARLPIVVPESTNSEWQLASKLDTDHRESHVITSTRNNAENGTYIIVV